MKTKKSSFFFSFLSKIFMALRSEVNDANVCSFMFLSLSVNTYLAEHFLFVHMNVPTQVHKM
jgi:hypothetical protein